MAKGLFFYKLISPYEQDVTKNCKLSVNEIDSNFLTLKDMDIKSAELDEENYAVILTRNNGDKLVVDLTPILSGSVYDLKVDFENPSDSGACNGANVYITYSTLTSGDVKTTVTVPITGLVTTENINKILGGGFLSRVITDGSLSGEGTIDSPLGISPTEKNRPAVKLIDKTKGEELPKTFTQGTRYITKEYASKIGYLYNYDAVVRINENLAAEGKGWRVPTKADWDCLLNSIEPCDYRDHESSVCHQILGKYAGTKLKSDCGWRGQDDCECKITKPIPGQHCGDDNADIDDNIDDDFDVDDTNDSTPTEVVNNCSGVDEFGMTILPTGYGDEEGRVYYEKDTTQFWTTTHVYNDLGQDVYVKKFDWNKCGVVQEATCIGNRGSIRLVKDYTGNNHFETETIDGLNYNTILFADCGTIWTTTNFASDKEEYRPTKSLVDESVYRTIVYYINVWNGKEWEKRTLSEGETVVIMEGNTNCQYNIEYRVYSEDGCNQILVNTDDTVVTRVIDEILPIINEEKEETEAAISALSGAIDTEREERIDADEEEKEERESADQILQEEIEAEVTRAQDVEQQLWDAINQESEAREEVDQQIWDAINAEVSARTDVESHIWDAINAEASARTDVESQIWDAINAEISARTDIDQQIWDAINAEVSARTDVESQLWDGINGETERAQTVETQLWGAITNEIENRVADINEIESQLIDGEQNYIMSADGGLKLLSKGGTNDVTIKFDADFGKF